MVADIHDTRELDLDASEHSNHATIRMVAEPWYIDEVVDTGGDDLLLTGWCLRDPGIPDDQQQARFLINGRIPDVVEYPLPRPDVQRFFWQRPDAEACGFRLKAPRAYPGGYMEVFARDTGRTGAAAAAQSWFLPDPGTRLALPDADRRFRVIGDRDAGGFLRVGATDAMRIKYAQEAASGAPLDSLSAVLDWGVGCGRVARHLAPMLEDRFFGCDIDSDNTSWCQRNLPGSYAVSALSPPLPYGGAAFDLVYGISVFTHLRRNWEENWLRELHRVIKPGGWLLATVHGQTAIDFAQLSRFDYSGLARRVQREGLVVTSENSQLTGFVEHPEEYVNVFHSHDHIRREWGRHFEIVDILPGYIFTHDLIIARRR
jgi:SAM-dependent methyltransferase